MNQLATADVEVKVWYEPSLDQFGREFRTFRPDLLHLIPAGMLHDDKMPEMVLSGGEKITRVRTDEFLSNLSNEIRPRLVVLNTCRGGDGGTGPSAPCLIAEHLRTVAIGWLGVIGDRDAVDFARLVYSRLLDGKTIVDALRSYRSIEPYKGHSDEATRDLGTVGHSRADDPIPVVWTAAISLRETPLQGLPDEEAELAEEREIRPRLGVEPTMRGVERLREEARPLVSSEPVPPALDGCSSLRSGRTPRS